MRARSCIAVWLLAILAGAAAKGITLPKELQTCKRGDDVCLLEAIQKAIPFLEKGNARLGLLPIDPLRVTEIFIDQGSGPVSIKLTLSNQDLIGIGDVAITKVSTDLTDEKYVARVQGTIPSFILQGDYKVEGRVLVLPIKGEGKNNLTLSDLKTNVVVNGHVVKKDGEEYVHIDDFLLSFDTTRLYIGLENLFNGDKAVGDNMLVFLNDNWRDILNELKPSLQDAVGAVLREICNRIYGRVPYAAMHPK